MFAWTPDCLYRKDQEGLDQIKSALLDESTRLEQEAKGLRTRARAINSELDLMYKLDMGFDPKDISW